jgi:ATP-dependent helicase IRC3
VQFTPRPYQEEAVRCTKKTYFEDGINNILIQKPTGTGKTEFFSMLPSALEIGNRRMLVLAHREELVQQAEKKLRQRNPDVSVGVEMGDRVSNGEQIVVASPQTIGRVGSPRLTKFKPEEFAIIVCDECHHSTSASYRTVFDHFGVRERKDILNIGVTATTKRGDGKGLGEVYDTIAFQMSILDAIRQGWLADLRCQKIITNVNIDHVGVSKGDFNVGELSAAINTPARNKAVVAAYREYGQGRKFIAFAEDVQHSKDLAGAFQSSGYRVEAIWGSDPDREKKLALHKAGELDGLVNCQLLTEGYDDWTIQCVIMARPTKSELLYTQMVGRGTRIPAGVSNLVEALSMGVEVEKRDCLVLDVVDVSTKHSLCTLPSLFGLNEKADLKGKPISDVLAEVEDLLKQNAALDVSQVEDLSQLKVYAEQVDLFNIPTPPEILQLSEYRWKFFGDTYYLSLKNNEMVFLRQNFLGKWKMDGHCNGYTLEGEFPTLETAVKEADYQVRMRGGKMYENMAKMVFKSEADPASAGQIETLRRMGITVPPGITKGQAHDRLSQEFRKREWRKRNQ